ncbi:hypothetical protein NE237_015227 [Protea cynaroides]|uniref:Uncharacterized protein n=1 Tax=Protea cynaroides TaxID=273540 RepID=A0A9Q0KDU8_9MAGN|nr:hypothetical protein NE237_015227 [Protea cynaroides]
MDDSRGVNSDAPVNGFGELILSPLLSPETADGSVNYSSLADEADFDEIENMRIRGNLFYKLDRDSRDFEEYNLSFRWRKNSKDSTKERKKENKKLRTLTFNQLTGSYHESICWDIYVSKGSVRACIVHRATSKVVAVAPSISKDMKFEWASTKDATACAVVDQNLV